MSADERPDRLLRHGLLLEGATLGWNVVGVVVVLQAAWRASSVALAGFGLDSLIEIGPSIVVIWQLRGTGAHQEKIALRVIGVAFLLLAVYILAQSSRSLLLRLHPAVSGWGTAWLALTFVAMLVLAAGKERVGVRLGNAVLRTEARVTLVDAYLAASVLLGISLNAVLNWWWADPLAGMVIVFYGLKEGVYALQESRSNIVPSP